MQHEKDHHINGHPVVPEARIMLVLSSPYDIGMID